MFSSNNNHVPYERRSSFKMTCLLVVLFTVKYSNSFSLYGHGIPKLIPTIKTTLQSTTNNKEQQKVKTETTQQNLQKQQIAKEALSKLLARQKREILETEALLASLSSLEEPATTQIETTSFATNFTNSDVGVEDITSNSASASLFSNSQAIATSVTAAFDYGFISRSEGCRFEDVDDFNE
jgi:hypothetical protein